MEYIHEKYQTLTRVLAIHACIFIRGDQTYWQKVKSLVTVVTGLKEFQRFERRPFVRRETWTNEHVSFLMKGLGSKPWNSLRSVTVVKNLLTFYLVYHSLRKSKQLLRLLPRRSTIVPKFNDCYSSIFLLRTETR